MSIQAKRQRLEEQAQKIAELPKLVTNGEFFAIKSGNAYFDRLVNDYPMASKSPVYFLKATAEERAQWCRGHLVPAPPGKAVFWMRHEGEDSYSPYDLQVEQPLQQRSELPEWFKSGVGEQNDDEAWWAFLAACGEHRWIDHWGWDDDGEEAALVAEPYGFHQNEAERLAAACHKFGFHYAITGKTAHHPGATIRITISGGQHERTETW